MEPDIELIGTLQVGLVGSGNFKHPYNLLTTISIQLPTDLQVAVIKI